MVRDDDGATAATVALDTFSDPRLWTPDEQADPSMYLHRLIVRRKYVGLGVDVIEWACQRAGQLGNHWVRIDVWTDSIGLHRYYEQNGFRHVRTLDLADYPSGALFQRPAIDPPDRPGQPPAHRRGLRAARHATPRAHIDPRRRCLVRRCSLATGPHHGLT
jgi:hypothetical protein